MAINEPERSEIPAERSDVPSVRLSAVPAGSAGAGRDALESMACYSLLRPRHWLLFAGSTGALALLVGLGAGSLPGWVLGGCVALAATLLAGVLVRRHRSARKTYPRWRDVMPCYLSVQDRDLRIVEVNDLFRRDFGRGVGSTCYRVYKDRDEPCPNCPVLRTFADCKPHSGEETVVTKDGERARVVVSSSPLFDEQGRCTAVVEMSTNITELSALRQELRQRKRDYQQLFNIVPCYVTVQDRDFRIIESNEAFRRDFSAETGLRCFAAYKGRESLCPDCPVEKSFADGEVHCSEETVTTRDGRRAEVIVYSMPVRDEQGEITGVMEVSTNITEVKQLQRQLAMMGLAVAGMAHRVKNILMGLEGGIFVVNTGFEMSDQQTIDEGWAMVERNVANISRTVKDLLFCAKERAPNASDGVALAEILDEVHQLYRRRAEQAGIAMEVSADPALSPGRYDAEGLTKLVTNLVSNALDACRFDPEQGKAHRITARAEPAEGGGVRLTVSDTGPGIPDDVQHKVFDNFFSTKGTEGTGLGLLVVKKVAEEHGGSVSFASRLGEGTTFTVELPPGGVPAVSEESEADTGAVSAAEAG